MNPINCLLCLPCSRFSPRITSALYEKYSTSSNFYFSRQIDDLLSHSHTKEVAEFQEMLLTIDTHELMKRQYLGEEFPQKIHHLTEYYKFNRDLPRCFDLSLQKPLMRYYQGLKKVDFRRVKNALKRQQGISITSQHSESSMQDSIVPLCSKYPSVLGDLALQNTSDSLALQYICKEINQALGRRKQTHRFKGRFEDQGRGFQAFISKEKNHNFNKNKITEQNLPQSKKTFKNTAKAIDRPQIISERNKKDVSKPNINGFNKALQTFYKLANIGNNQCLKPKKTMLFRQSKEGRVTYRDDKNAKSKNQIKNPHQQKNMVEGEKLHRQTSKRHLNRNSSSFKLQQLGRNQANENNKNICNRMSEKDLSKGKDRNRRSISISRDRSKGNLQKEKSVRKISISNNNTERSHSKAKQKKEKHQTKIDRMFNKKLNVFR